ncbi:fatty acid hydroxylase family protein [Leptospira johnsonii]|uniref:Fatty acid hydroxylase family protein n=1 Tax=Leptospira johnsonii TaxID=1917820 RepID=A0A2P2D0B8_9LEPT|nr:fatty acid hydroxylase family protein [Leptospira johnsonii]
MYWLNGEKRHPIHAILEGSPGILLVLLLGASSEIVLGWLTILSLHLMFQHGNMDYKAGILKKFFSVAELHRWHHRKKYRETQVNYGAVFSFWDRMFGSLQKEEGFVTGAAVGLEREKSFPKDYLGQLTEPFR